MNAVWWIYIHCLRRLKILSWQILAPTLQYAIANDLIAKQEQFICNTHNFVKWCFIQKCANNFCGGCHCSEYL